MEKSLICGSMKTASDISATQAGLVQSISRGIRLAVEGESAVQCVSKKLMRTAISVIAAVIAAIALPGVHQAVAADLSV